MSFDNMLAVGRLTGQCLRELKSFIRPGMTTKDIEDYVRGFQEQHNLRNSQHGYFGFPGLCCTSVNEIVCHGIPHKDIVLNEGDIVKVDVTFNLDGFHGDACFTYEVGECDRLTKKLVDAARSSLYMAISKCRPGKTVADIGRVIQDYISSVNMHVVQDFTGHGIGQRMHQPPFIPHVWHPEKEAIILKPGMTFTIEPIITLGNPTYGTLSDGWTTYTKDGLWAAQFEHTIGITEDAPVVFTL